MKRRKGIINTDLMTGALKESFKKLAPQIQFRNPVMFVTYLGAIFTTLGLIFGTYSSFNFQITLWLWFTVLFANFASAIAESRGKAQADNLKKTQTETYAKKLVNQKEISILAADLKKGDCIACE